MSVEIAWIATFIMPILIFVMGLRFTSRKLAILRVLTAILVGWGCMYFYVLYASSIAESRARATGTLEEYYNSDGAPMAFVVLFGWVVPAVLVLGTWFLNEIFKRFKHNRSSIG